MSAVWGQADDERIATTNAPDPTFLLPNKLTLEHMRLFTANDLSATAAILATSGMLRL